MSPQSESFASFGRRPMHPGTRPPASSSGGRPGDGSDFSRPQHTLRFMVYINGGGRGDSRIRSGSGNGGGGPLPGPSECLGGALPVESCPITLRSLGVRRLAVAFPTCRLMASHHPPAALRLLPVIPFDPRSARSSSARHATRASGSLSILAPPRRPHPPPLDPPPSRRQSSLERPCTPDSLEQEPRSFRDSSQAERTRWGLVSPPTTS